MKISFHHYYVSRRAQPDLRLTFDLPAFLRAFCDAGVLALKRDIVRDEENLYLYRGAGADPDDFLFAATKDKETVRRIDTANLRHQDIRPMLGETGTVAFGSYVRVSSDWVGVASSGSGPRTQCFVDFVNLLFERIGITDHAFEIEALMASATETEVQEWDFISTTGFKIPKDSGFFAALAALGSLSESPDWEHVDGIQVQIVPKYRKNIAGVAKRLSSVANASGLSDFRMRAKREAESKLADYILDVGGRLSAPIEHSILDSEQRIFEKMRYAAQGSADELTAAITRAKATKVYQGMDAVCGAVRGFDSADHWNSRFPDAAPAPSTVRHDGEAGQA